jgi:hypothetical protein
VNETTTSEQNVKELADLENLYDDFTQYYKEGCILAVISVTFV